MFISLSAKGFTIFRSEATLSATPGYCTFTAKVFPLRVALCTCPMEAALVALWPKLSKISAGGFPRVSLMVFTTSGYERGGALY